jgi:PHD/YefM family antitoxin component YafN of YafNO toxin-antitoxin module
MYTTKAPRRATKKAARNRKEQFVINADGKKTAVLLSLKHYEKLLEDLHDLAVVAERRAEQPITLEEMKRRLKKNGVL